MKKVDHAKAKKPHPATRILISLIGAGLIYMGISQILLGIAGTSTIAKITHIRREGGERAESIPGRYTYNISYTFTLDDGQEITSVTKRIGDSLFIKADGTSPLPIRYIAFLPQINAPERDTGIHAGSIALILIGIFLIVVMNKMSVQEE